MKWDDIDFQKGTIHVLRNLVKVENANPVFGEVKTSSSRRKVPIDEETLKILKMLRHSQLQDRLKAGVAWQENGLVFVTRKGKPLHSGQFREQIKNLTLKAGVPPLNIHGLRHTHATLLLRQGVHPKVVSERLGHSRISITLDRYSHLLEDTQAQATKAMNNILSQ